MKKILLILFLSSFLFSDGPYSVQSITEQDGLRDGPDFSSGIVYFPVDAPGPLPIIVLIPGYVSYISSIEDWGAYLASYGIVTMFVNVNNIFLDPYYRSSALLDGIISIKLENERLDSPLFENLNIDEVAVGGWSMGGGGAQLAAQQDMSIRAVVGLSPWLSNSNDSYENNTPILYLSGQFDVVAPNNFHTNIFYNNTPESTDKLLYEISGGTHSTVCSPYNDNAMALKVLFWVEKYIMDNSTNCDLLISPPISASEFLTNIECENLINGDLNQDGIVNIQDIILTVNLVLNNGFDNSVDMNLDGTLNILDVIQIINIILN
tara:strand:+ start:2334 stop:3296 length:963 start_codon:yes stop_codon:yes gene_type:complete